MSRHMVMELRVTWLVLAILVAACVRAPEIPAALDPSRADAPEGAPPPELKGRNQEPDAPAEPPHHGHGGHGPGQDHARNEESPP